MNKDINKLIKVKKMFTDATKRFEYFECHEWKYLNKKSIALLRTLSPEEQVEFNCDVNDLDWDEYLHVYSRGI